MKKLLLKIAIGIMALTGLGTVVYGAPTAQNFQNIQPFINNTYDNGSVLLNWLHFYTKYASTTALSISSLTSKNCLGTDSTGLVITGTCSSSGGSGNVGTSTTDVAGQVTFFTTNGATPALIAGNANLTFASGNGLLTGLSSVFTFSTTTNFLALGSTTLQNFTFRNATGTSATTTNFFSTNASTTNLFAGFATTTNATSTNFFSTNASTTNFNAGFATITNATTTNLFATTASTTRLNVGFSTTTNATTTNFFSTNASTTNLNVGFSTTTNGTSTNYWISNILSAQSASTTNLFVYGSSTLQNFTFVNATGTSATTTNLSTTNASTTNLFLSTGTGCLSASATGLVSASGVACGTGSGSSNTDKFATSSTQSFTITPNTAVAVTIGRTATTTNSLFEVAGTSTMDHIIASSTTGFNAIGTTTIAMFPTARPLLNVQGTTTIATPYMFVGSSLCKGTIANQGIGFELCGSANSDAGGVQIQAGNNSNGSAAWSGLDLNNDLADVTLTHFAGMFFNSSQYTSTFYGTAIGVKNAAYVQNADGELDLISSTSSEAFNPAGIRFYTGGTTAGVTGTGNERGRLTFDGYWGLGTSTPKGGVMTIASSSQSQLVLSDGTATVNRWNFRNAGGNLYIATSSAATTATSTVTALRIDPNGQPSVPFLKNCNTIDTDTNGAMTCGVDAGLQLPTLVVAASGGDFTTIQGALDRCATLGGATIYLTDTTYAQAGTGLLWKGSNCNIYGRDATTTITFTGATTGFKTNSAVGLFGHNGLHHLVITGDNTTNAVAIDGSDMNHNIYEDIKIDNIATDVRLNDTQNITFYNMFRDMDLTTIKTFGINASSTKPANDNTFSNIFIGCSNNTGCIGVNLNNAQANHFYSVTIEPGGTTNTQGIQIRANSLTNNNGTFSNDFHDVYVEGNTIGISASSTVGSAVVFGNNFFGGQIETNTQNVVTQSADQFELSFYGSGVNFINTNTTGVSTVRSKNNGNIFSVLDDGFSNAALIVKNNVNFAQASLDFTKFSLLNTSDTANLLNLSNAGAGATIIATSSEHQGFILDRYGDMGIGTTTPQWKLQISSSTASQLTLSDSTAGVNHWSFRNAGGNLYIGTSSPTTFATSSISAISIVPSTFSAIAVGSSTPYGILDVVSSATTRPLFAISTSTSGGSFADITSVWATTSTLLGTVSGADSGARFGIGTTTIHGVLNLDQLYVDGRINTSDRYLGCDQFGQTTTPITQLAGDTANVCGEFYFVEDTAAVYDQVAQLGSGDVYARLRTGSAGTVSAASDGAGIAFPLTWLGTATNTPVMEVTARKAVMNNASSSLTEIGLTDYNGLSADFATVPANGCYFEASSSATNWWLVASNGGTHSTVDTGVASSSSVTATGKYQKFRIELGSSNCTGYITNGGNTNYVKMKITTNVPTTVALGPSVSIADVTNAGLAKELHVRTMRLWYRGVEDLNVDGL